MSYRIEMEIINVIGHILFDYMSNFIYIASNLWI